MKRVKPTRCYTCFSESWNIPLTGRSKNLQPCMCIFSKLYTKLTLHCNHRSGHLKTEHTESLFLLRRHLGNWSCSKHEKQTAGSAQETWTVAAADGVCCARVRWEINFLLTFETTPFFCVYPVFLSCVLTSQFIYLQGFINPLTLNSEEIISSWTVCCNQHCTPWIICVTIGIHIVLRM